MKKIFKAIQGFPLMDGLEIKRIESFKGHEKETLFRGNIYLDGEKIGSIEDGHNGSGTDFEIFDEDAQRKIYSFVEDGKFYREIAGSKMDITPQFYMTLVLSVFGTASTMKKFKKTRTYTLERDGKVGYFNISEAEFKKQKDNLLSEGEIILSDLLYEEQ